MFDRLFKKKATSQTKEISAARFVIANLNARLQPKHRAYFEDPVTEELTKAKCGEVSGGGSLLSKQGEIQECDIEITVAETSPEVVRLIIDTLERLGAPKGSKLQIVAENRAIAFGTTEGLAVYLNGTDLPAETYRQCDSNFVYSEFNRLLEGEGRVLSYWQGPTESALYAYGKSFAGMQARLADFIATYPLCQKCRIEQIA